MGVHGPRADLLAEFEAGGTERALDRGLLAIPRVGSLVRGEDDA